MTDLCDGQGRRVDYLRLSVTDRCDLRCSYCLPKGFRDYSEPAHWLTPAELERLARIFVSLGVRRIRLTGGEPLTRQGIVDIAARLRAIESLGDLSLSTNATRLARHTEALREAGVNRLNVSLDTLDRAEYARLTGKDALPDVLSGLEAACRAGFELIKINMVALPGLSVEAVERMVAYCIERGFVLRLIEMMPMGEAGRRAGYLSLDAIERELLARHPLRAALIPGGGPARYLRHDADPRFSIGFITPRSQHFCATCNRVRLTASGELHLCLGHEDQLNLGVLLREGATDEAIGERIRLGLARKPAMHDFNRSPGRSIRVMAATGG